MSVWDEDDPIEGTMGDVGMDPALLQDRIGESPLLEQARENVADTAERAEELREVDED